jgi:osmoprotectant transport system substrate-binding protein
MKVRSLALGSLLTLSLVLSACGGDATPTPGSSGGAGSPTNTPAASTGGSNSGRKVVVSSKNFTEEVIIGEMYALALEAKQIPVDRKLNLGTTDVAQEALLKGGANGGIDLYPEYTGTGLFTVLKSTTPIADPDQAYQAVKDGYAKLNPKLVWLNKTPMNDTQAMATTKEVSDKLGIKSLQDLCDKAGQVTVAAVAEFKTREDALPALQKTYGGCNFKDIKIFEPNLRYKALTNKDVDVAQAFSTDGPIAGNGLVVLSDPKNWGPPDNVAPVVRDDVLQQYPQITDALNAVSAKITNEAISDLNWQVDGQGKDAHDVAKQWMYDNGLIPK